MVENSCCGMVVLMVLSFLSCGLVVAIGTFFWVLTMFFPPYLTLTHDLKVLLYLVVQMPIQALYLAVCLLFRYYCMFLLFDNTTYLTSYLTRKSTRISLFINKRLSLFIDELFLILMEVSYR